MRGAWIEMYFGLPGCGKTTSHPVRGAWIEILALNLIGSKPQESHPVRGAWIEIRVYARIEA